MNSDFAWDRSSLSEVDPVSSLLHIIDKDIVIESKMEWKKKKNENGKAAEPSGNGKDSRRTWLSKSDYSRGSYSSTIVSCCKRKEGLWKEKTKGVCIRSD